MVVIYIHIRNNNVEISLFYVSFKHMMLLR